MGFILASHYFIFKKNKIKPHKKNNIKGSVCTIVAGFTSFCVHAGGTPTSIYLLPLRLKKEIYVGTRVIFFTFVNLIKLPLYIHLSMMNTGTLINSILLFLPIAKLVVDHSPTPSIVNIIASLYGDGKNALDAWLK